MTRTNDRFWSTLRQIAGSVVLIATVGACSTPIGVSRVKPERVHRMLTSSVLTTGDPSGFTTNVLHERNLHDTHGQDPASAIASLHRMVVDGRPEQDDLLALSELSFLHAEHKGEKPRYLAAAIYAYAYLFGEVDISRTSRFDPRTRLAVDLYNRALTESFKVGDGTRVIFESAEFELPFGTIRIEVDPSGYSWGSRNLQDFIPVAELAVKGLRTRHRQPGIGAPLAAAAVPLEGEQERPDILWPGARLPVTAFLRIDGPLDFERDGGMSGRIELYPGYRLGHVDIANEQVPLEAEGTATLALQLSESSLWSREIRGFFGGAEGGVEPPMLRSLEPYRAGSIPVVFVHGTASSPGRWAQLVNDVFSNPEIADRYFPLFFLYDTGNPIAYSAMLLREMIRDVYERVEPLPEPACLNDTVVIGHSQGGLLAKLMVVDSGDRLWRTLSSRPLQEMELKPEARDLVERALLVEAMPEVSRVIFIATPHRGSFLAGNFVSNTVSTMVDLPSEVVDAASDLLTNDPEAEGFELLEQIPTSVENMTPGSPFIQALAELDISDSVAVHSIIAVKGDGPVSLDNDGVVEYASAHLLNSLSEAVVQSNHSTQSHPNTIAEVRRILAEHIQRSPCAALPKTESRWVPTINASAAKDAAQPPPPISRGSK